MSDEKKTEIKKVHSLKFKITRRILSILIIVVSVLLIYTLSTSKRAISSYSNELLQAESIANVEKVNRFIDSIFRSLDAVKDTMENVDFTNDAEEMKYLLSTLSLNPNLPTGIYTGDNSGKFVDPSGWVPDESYVVTDRDWYLEGLNNEEFTLGKPYLDMETGNYVVSATTLLKKSMNTKRVLSTDISLENIMKEVANINVLGTGYALLIDTSTGTILAHKDSDKVAMNLYEITNDSFFDGLQREITAGNQNIFQLQSKEGKLLSIIKQVEGTDWALVSCVLQSDVLKDYYQMERNNLIISVAILVVLIIIVERTIHIALNPIKRLTKSIIQITDGDFTVDIDVKGRDELAIMSQKLKLFIAGLREMIVDAINISGKLSSQSSIGKEISSDLYQLAEEQSGAMNEMNTTMGQITCSISEIAENATSLANMVTNTNADGKEANNRMNDTVLVAENGYKDMQQIHNAMENIEGSIQELKETVEMVGSSTVEINEIIKLIGNIAGQTNLLALNASIEAARAGEHGRGFSVVADEIRQLAETSTNAVKKIGALVADINKQVEKAIIKTHENVEEIGNNTSLINNASKTFDDIFENVTNTSSIIKNIIENINRVDDIACNMAAIIEEQSASAQEILATSENLTSNSSKVTDGSSNILEDAKEIESSAIELEKLMSTFKI